jgi:hypothetical protein
MTENISTVLLDRRRDDDAYRRLMAVMSALRLWRRTLASEMSSVDDIPDSKKQEPLLDLLSGEMEECFVLINATAAAAERILDRRVKAENDAGPPILGFGELQS